MIGHTQWWLSNAPWFAGLLGLGVALGWATSAWRQRRRGERRLRFVQAVRSEARRIARRHGVTSGEDHALTTVFQRPVALPRVNSEPLPTAPSVRPDVTKSFSRPTVFAAHEGVRTSLYNLRELLLGEGE